MSLSREMRNLYQNLHSDVISESLDEKGLIEATLTSDNVRSNLEFRLRIVQIVGLIKFFNNLPIYVPEVEEKILDGIKKDSIIKNLNPVLTTSFFKVVMEHSKAVQARLGELLNGKDNEAKQILADAVFSLKQDVPEKADIFTSLGDEKVLASQNLQHCRGLIQTATDNVLGEMAAVSERLKASRISAIATYGLFGSMATTAGITKLPSGSIGRWPDNNADGKPSTELRPNAVYYP